MKVNDHIFYSKQPLETIDEQSMLIDEEYDTLDIKITPEILMVNGK